MSSESSNKMSSYIDSSQYMNMMMSNIIFKQLSSIINANTKITGKIIIQMLAMMSLDELRKFLMCIIKNIIRYVNENYLNILEWINDNILKNFLVRNIFLIFNYIKKMFLTDQNIYKMNDYTLQIETKNYMKFEFKSNLEFMDSLIKYIKNNESCSYNILNHKKIIINDLKSYEIEETFQNVKINYDDIDINLYQPIKTVYTLSKSGVKIKNYNLKFVYDINNTYNSLIDLVFDDKIKLIVNASVNEIIEQMQQETTQQNKFVFQTYNDIKTNEFINVETLKKDYMLLTNFKFIDMAKSILEYEIIKNMTGTSFTMYISKIFKIPDDKHIHRNIFTEYIKKYEREIYLFQISKYYKEISEFNKNCENAEIPKIENDFMIMNVSSTKDEENINNTFNNFIKEISSYIEPMKINKKIKVNIITIKKNKIVNSIPNPEYVAYEEQKNNINEFAQNGKNELLIKEFLLKTPPLKTIDKIEIKKEVIVEEINEVYKSLDTLYLRKSDHEKLKKILHSFLHQQDMYQELGLPNKLNVFLSGLPGTGKTTIIQVIASYLQKNIYYCNINDGMTNEDVQMIFDHVLKNSIGGGIIVSEDVDAMTHIVHKRIKDISSASSVSISSIDSEKSIVNVYEKKDNSLTLEYLLNILQGSLTQDGTIFIATTNHKELIDPAFYRDGRFDVKIDMKLCDKYQINCIYKKFMNREIPEEILERIKEDEYTPANFIFRIKDYICSDLGDEAILEPFII